MRRKNKWQRREKRKKKRKGKGGIKRGEEKRKVNMEEEKEQK